MNATAEKSRILSSIIYLLYLFFFLSFTCSFRAVTSISIGLILVTGILKNKLDKRSFFPDKIKGLFFPGCLAFFLLLVISLLFTRHQPETWSQLRLKSGLLLIPLAVYCSGTIKDETRKKLFLSYCLILAGASLYCLLMIIIHYRHPFDPSLLFYHALVSPLGQHAVYFSIYVFVALVFLCESLRKNDLLIPKQFHIALILYFSIFLIFLSSKLVIAFYLVYLVIYFIGIIQTRKPNRWMVFSLFSVIILAMTLLLTTSNPVSERFREVLESDVQLVKQDNFDKGDYFNGLQFRILEWRFVSEILHENHSWWLGVSPGDAQALLDQKYSSKNMYTGEPARGDQGFLGYNTHNQFLEALLQTGIIGLSILLLICYSLVRLAWQKKDRGTSFIFMLLLAWLFSESAFETQYGILIFTFFPLFVSPYKE